MCYIVISPAQVEIILPPWSGNDHQKSHYKLLRSLKTQMAMLETWVSIAPFIAPFLAPFRCSFFIVSPSFQKKVNSRNFQKTHRISMDIAYTNLLYTSSHSWTHGSDMGNWIQSHPGTHFYHGTHSIQKGLVYLPTFVILKNNQM